jgi:hypothetical protein
MTLDLSFSPTRAESVAWAGGLFDGEGCLTWSVGAYADRNPQFKWQMTINMNDEDSIRRFHDVVKVGYVRQFYPPEHRLGGRQSYWRWSVSRRNDIKIVVDLLFPWVNGRRQAKFSEFVAWYTEVGPSNWGQVQEPRGHCQHCDKSRRLRKDGAFLRHTYSTGIKMLCPGSGHKPERVSRG